MFDAEARRASRDECSGWDAGLGEEGVPIPGAEGTAEGDGAVVHADRVPADDAAEQGAKGLEAKHGADRDVEASGARGAGEVIDEPAEGGGAVLPGEDANDLGVFKVVHEEAGQDEIRRLGEGEREGVGGEPGDGGTAETGVMGPGAEIGFAGKTRGLRVEINAGEGDGEATYGGPAADTAEGVSSAGADVEDAQGAVRSEGDSLPGGVPGGTGEKGEGGAIGAGDAVDLFEGVEAVSEGVEAARGIHELGEGVGGGATREGGWGEVWKRHVACDQCMG